jgi:multiple sugar transport system ATP-binding protein
MSVAENMGFALKMQGIHKDERAKRVQDAAKLVGLEEYLQRAIVMCQLCEVWLTHQ